MATEQQAAISSSAGKYSTLHTTQHATEKISDIVAWDKSVRLMAWAEDTLRKLDLKYTFGSTECDVIAQFVNGSGLISRFVTGKVSNDIQIIKDEESSNLDKITCHGDLITVIATRRAAMKVRGFSDWLPTHISRFTMMPYKYLSKNGCLKF